MSATRMLSMKLSHALAEGIDQRWQSLGFPSRNAYFRSLARQDMARPKQHALGRAVEEMPLDQQDLFDRYLVRRPNLGGQASHD